MEETATKKPHISASALDMFSKCGEQYRRRYIERHIIPPGVALLRGGAVHVGSEINFGQKIETRQDLPKAQIVEAAVSAFEGKEKAEGVLLSKEEEARGKKIVLGEAKDSTAALAGLYRDAVAPEYQPRLVEITHRIVLPKAPMDIVLVMDFVGSEVAKPDAEGIMDLKTGKKAKTQADADDSTQLTIYSAGYRDLVGKAPDFLALESLVALKSAPKRSRVETTRSPADFGALANRINAATRGIFGGFFSPASPGSWWCSPKWCGYWRTCHYVNSERSEAAKAAE